MCIRDRPDEERYSDADIQPSEDPNQIQRDALERLKALLNEHMSDERLLMTWFGQFMTEPKYPELVAGIDVYKRQAVPQVQKTASTVEV